MNSNAWNNPVKARFATYAVLTAENPDRMAGIASTLAAGKYPFKRIKGNSVVVGGISLDTAKNFSQFYKLQSFAFIRRGDETPKEIDTEVKEAIEYLDNFLVSKVLSKPGQYGKLMEGLAGGPKTKRYYYQCRCTGMAGATYGPDGVITGTI